MIAFVLASYELLVDQHTGRKCRNNTIPFLFFNGGSATGSYTIVPTGCDELVHHDRVHRQLSGRTLAPRCGEQYCDRRRRLEQGGCCSYRIHIVYYFLECSTVHIRDADAYSIIIIILLVIIVVVVIILCTGRMTSFPFRTTTPAFLVNCEQRRGVERQNNCVDGKVVRTRKTHTIGGSLLVFCFGVVAVR